MDWPIFLYALIPFVLLMLVIILVFVVHANVQVRAAARLARQAREDEINAAE